MSLHLSSQLSQNRFETLHEKFPAHRCRYRFFRRRNCLARTSSIMLIDKTLNKQKYNYKDQKSSGQPMIELTLQSHSHTLEMTLLLFLGHLYETIHYLYHQIFNLQCSNLHFHEVSLIYKQAEWAWFNKVFNLYFCDFCK